MKKTRTIALALIVAVALIGAGYAAWDTQIKDTTVLQTGQLKVVLEADADTSYWAADQVNTFHSDLVEHKGSIDKTYDTYPVTKTDNENYVYTIAPIPGKGVISSGNVNNGITECTFQFYNLHPGTKAMTRFEMRNDGTIPAQIKSVDVDILDANGNSLLNNGTLTASGELANAINAMNVKPYFEIHHGTGNSETKINFSEVNLMYLKAALNQKLVGKVLAPSDTFYTIDKSSDELESGIDGNKPVFTFHLPANSLTGSEGSLQQFKVVIRFNFVQYNEIVSAARQ